LLGNVRRTGCCSAHSRHKAFGKRPRVEREYGLVAKGYGRTLEIDHIVSLELGGSNDVGNLFPEASPGYDAKD